MGIESVNRVCEDFKNNKKEITIGQKIKGHFILTRPLQLIWFDIFASLAVFAIVAQHFPNAHYLLFMLAAITADAGACTINDFGDLSSDSKSTESSRKLRPLPAGIISKRAAVIQAAILYTTGLLIALYLGYYIFIAAFFLVVLSIQYSLKPLKMDGRPVVSQLFWVAFGLMYYLAVVAYLIKYEHVAMQNIYNGLYFLMTMVIFAGLAETLAKDLRDLENDRTGGKITTPVYFGVKPAVVGSFVFSMTGMIFWAIPFFTVWKTHGLIQFFIILIFILWSILCLGLCWSLFKKYSKINAKKLHQGYILTFTYILAITFFAGVT